VTSIVSALQQHWNLVTAPALVTSGLEQVVHVRAGEIIANPN